MKNETKPLKNFTELKKKCKYFEGAKEKTCPFFFKAETFSFGSFGVDASIFASA